MARRVPEVATVSPRVSHVPDAKTPVLNRFLGPIPTETTRSGFLSNCMKRSRADS